MYTGELTSSLVVMGVAGSGKSTLGEAVARRMGWPMIEGDNFHSEENRTKMHAGVPLSDADRMGWLRSLARELQRHPAGAVLACSALKRSYRDILRAASPGLAFVFLDISEEEALWRVSARGDHFFPPELLQSQFDALEAPVDEPRILSLDAGLPLPSLVDQTVAWLTTNSGSPA
jgi:gluconokinase